MTPRIDTFCRKAASCGLFLLALAWTSQAQGQYSKIAQVDGPVASDKLGWSVAGAGDVNGDGVPDYLVGMPYYDPSGLSSAGAARVYSGATGALLYQKNGSASAEGLGYYVAGAGDVNGDGRADFIVASQSSAFVFSGANGGLLYQKPAGGPVAGLNDINGDGRSDFAVSDLNQTLVYSGATGAMLYAKVGGSAVSSVGDVNADGRNDFLIGDQYADPGLTNAGSAYVFSGATGALIYQKNGAVGSDLLGGSVAGTGDVNGDGRPDFIVGARLADVGGQINTGAAYVYSGATGALLYQKTGPAGQQWGQAVGGAGDADGDGKADFLVSSIWTSPNGHTSAGSVFLYSGANGSLLAQFDGLVEYENFGYVVAGVGDINSNGKSDFIVGGPNACPGGRLYAGTGYLFGAGGSVDPCANDLIAPVLVCPVNKTAACGQAIVYDTPSATDNCDPAPVVSVVSTTQTPGPGTGQTTYTRTWVARDSKGNTSAQCSQSIVQTCTDPCATDVTPPVLTCPNGKTASCGQTIVYDTPTATDNCDPAPVVSVVSTTQTPGPGTGQTTYTRTWVARDAKGNTSAQCSQSIVYTCVQAATYRSQVTPAGETCAEFTAQTASDLSQFCYSVRRGKISSTDPTSFMYFVSLTAPSSSFTVDIVQTRSGTITPFVAVANHGVKAYDNCTQIASGISPSAGQAQVTIAGATAGRQYIIEVTYAANSLVGTPASGSGSLFQHFDFAARLNGQEVTRDAGGVSPVNCTVTKGGGGASGVPNAVAVESYPNPFNAQAEILYFLPEDGRVTVEIFNVLGQRVRELVNAQKAAGTYSVLWNGKNDAGRDVPSGIYLLAVRTREESAVMKLQLLK